MRAPSGHLALHEDNEETAPVSSALATRQTENESNMMAYSLFLIQTPTLHAQSISTPLLFDLARVLTLYRSIKLANCALDAGYLSKNVGVLTPTA